MAFESIVKPLLFLHLVAAVCALATGVHLGLRLIKALRRSGAYAGQTKLHATIMAISYTISFALGALIYPTFRVRVRGEYLDSMLPWATGLFEIKEHMASLALLPAIAVLLLSRFIDLRNTDHRPYTYMYATCLAMVIAALSFNAWCGWYLGTLKSV